MNIIQSKIFNDKMKKLDDIDHIAIQVDDIKKSLNWYLKKFKCYYQ